MNELLLQSPLCQVGCATFPEAFTLLPSLGDDRPGRLDFQKTSLVPSHWTGQYVWAPEAFTCPVTLDRPGTTGHRTNRQNCQLAAVSFPRLLCLGSTPLFFFCTGIWRE